MITYKNLDIKESLTKLPRKHPGSSSEEFNHFSNLFKELLKDDIDNKNIKAKLNYHLKKLWSNLLNEFLYPGWFYNIKGFDKEMQTKYYSGQIDIEILKIRLGKALDANELEKFFENFPYIKDLLIIDQYINKEDRSEEDQATLKKIVEEYSSALEYHDKILPLLVLREHIYLILDRPFFDKEFYKQHMKGSRQCIKEQGKLSEMNLTFLSLFIQLNIPYSVKKSEEFKEFCWDTFDNLWKHPLLVDKITLKLVEDFEKYFEGIISFQLGDLKKEDLHKIDTSHLINMKSEVNLESALTIIDYYIDIAQKIDEDNEISRLATLRIITAIGEAISKIQSLIPKNDLATLKKVINLRDHIAHSSTYNANKYLEELIYKKEDNTLPEVLLETKNLRQYFHNLKEYLSKRSENDFPKLSETTEIEKFDSKYNKARHKDDRDEKLSLGYYKQLELTIPTAEKLTNYNYSRIDGFINGRIDGRIYSIDQFTSDCIIYTKSKLKNEYEKRKELNQITRIRENLSKENFDFKTNLKLKTEDQNHFEYMKSQKNIEELKRILDQHEEKNRFDTKNFLSTVKEINLNQYKATLRNFIIGNTLTKEKEERFEQALKILFDTNLATIQIWRDAYAKIRGDKLENFKNDKIIDLKYSILSIQKLKEISLNILDSDNLDINKNPIASAACEMLYGFCSNNFKWAVKHIDQLYDYSDKTLPYFNYKHPIEETRKLLDDAIQIRNQIFHFERMFKEADSIELSRELWFSAIQSMTHGLFFPKAIVFSEKNILTDSLHSISVLEKLSEFLSHLKINLETDTLNMDLLYELATNTNPLISFPEEHNATQNTTEDAETAILLEPIGKACYQESHTT